MIEDVHLMDPSQIKDYLVIIRDAGMRIKHLTENYLLYAQLEVTAQRPGMLASMRDQVSERPGQVVASIARGCAETAKRQEDLSLCLDEAALPVAIAAEHLSKLVEELVVNAFKFSQQGTAVHVGLSATPTSVVLTVSDVGRGMTREQINAIGAYMQFERHRYEQQGTGMGLALARKIVQLHDGRLDITSAPGEGTTVRVELPIAACAAAAVTTMRDIA
jgi:signal transduction histidine kinase